MRSHLEVLRENIATARRKKGWSQNDLAKQLGISGPALSDNLSGDNVGIKKLKDIADKLDVSVQWLFTDHAAKPAENTADSERLAIISLVLSLDKKELPGVLSMLEDLTDSSLEKRKLPPHR